LVLSLLLLELWTVSWRRWGFDTGSGHDPQGRVAAFRTETTDERSSTSPLGRNHVLLLTTNAGPRGPVLDRIAGSNTEILKVYRAQGAEITLVGGEPPTPDQKSLVDRSDLFSSAETLGAAMRRFAAGLGRRDRALLFVNAAPQTDVGVYGGIGVRQTGTGRSYSWTSISHADIVKAVEGAGLGGRVAYVGTYPFSGALHRAFRGVHRREPRAICGLTYSHWERGVGNAERLHLDAALGSRDADLDRDGQISLFEFYLYSLRPDSETREIVLSSLDLVHSEAGYGPYSPLLFEVFRYSTIAVDVVQRFTSRPSPFSIRDAVLFGRGQGHGSTMDDALHALEQQNLGLELPEGLARADFDVAGLPAELRSIAVDVRNRLMAQNPHYEELASEFNRQTRQLLDDWVRMGRIRRLASRSSFRSRLRDLVRQRDGLTPSSSHDAKSLETIRLLVRKLGTMKPSAVAFLTALLRCEVDTKLGVPTPAPIRTN